MSDMLSLFLKEKKTVRENVFYAVTDSFKDEKGNVIKWELRPVTTQEDEEIRADSMVYDGERTRLNMNKYISAVAARAVVFPDLYDAKLQDSYGVKKPEDLLKAMVDKPGDFNRLVDRVQNLNGFTTFEEDIEKAKN